MENRGQKRSEEVEELPADKRACSSLEFKATSSVQTQMVSANSNPENHSHDMETSLPSDKGACSSLECGASSSGSSVHAPLNSDNSKPGTQDDDIDASSASSLSSESDGEDEKDFHGKGDRSGHEHASLRDCQLKRSEEEQGKIWNLMTTLSDDSDYTVQLAGLTNLCEVLSFCSGNSMSTSLSDLLSPALVKLANHETSPDIMLFATRAISYMCDSFPTAPRCLVRHNAVTALCRRLMTIEYLDVAEECLHALDKISRDQPLLCFESGAIMAALTYIDFFSTNIQRVAVSIAVNICKEIPSERPSPFMEAVPILCNLLQNEDRQLVENAASCLIAITNKVGESPELLDQLCQHGLVNQATHLINLNNLTTLSQPIHVGLIGMLVKLASGSLSAVVILVDLNISSILKELLSSYELSHGMPSSRIPEGHCNQVHEVLKFLNKLLPTVVRGDQDDQPASNEDSYLVTQPNLLHKFALDVLVELIQVVDSGANMVICYGCLSIINKIAYFSKPGMLLELLKNINMSNFLAGVLTRKDHHVLIVALDIIESLLQKLPDYFLNSFVKEGVFFAVDELRSVSMDVSRCLCYAFDTGRVTSNNGNCKFDNEYLQNLAKRIQTNYFTEESLNPDKGLSDIFCKLKTYSAALTELSNIPVANCASAEQEKKCSDTMHQILTVLTGSEPISTFEFIESGIIKSLMAYLSNGRHMGEDVKHQNFASDICVLEKKFVNFASQLLSLSDSMCEDFPLSAIIRKSLSALSTVENFPVMLSHLFKKSHSYTTVPQKQRTPYPSFRVRFVRDETEMTLVDYTKGVQTADPLSSLDAIEKYLLPKVTKTECVESSANCVQQSYTPSETTSEEIMPDISSALRGMQVDRLSHSEPEEAVNARQPSLDESHEGVINTGSAKLESGGSSETDNKKEARLSVSANSEVLNSPNLSFYLDGHQWDPSLTLYQAIIQQKMKVDNVMINSEKLWSQVHIVTYKRTSDSKESRLQNGCQFTQDSSASDKAGMYRQFSPIRSCIFDSEFDSKLASDLDKSSPTYNILFLLKSLQSLNASLSHLMFHETIYAFAEGKIKNLDKLMSARAVSQNELVSSKLTEKLEQQMRDPLAFSIGGLPTWCNQLMVSCPFLFAFETRRKYFHLAAFGPILGQFPSPCHGHSYGNNSSPSQALPRKKFLVCRDHILDSAFKMMDLHAGEKAVIEVLYDEEVGTGLGPTLEFYTLVSQEFQKPSLSLWRGDHNLSRENFEIAVSHYGLFPRPWSSSSSASTGILFSEVLKTFFLLGQVVAKALQDGRFLDVPFSKAFYKLILGQEICLYDIDSFDPELGRTLIEFKSVIERKKVLDSVSGVNQTFALESYFRGTRIEDLHLDFTLPGYPDYKLASRQAYDMVCMSNLEEYVSHIVDATIGAGVLRQVEAFRSGFNQVFPIKHLQVFTEEEMEQLLCGECDSWNHKELLDHVKFDHGYTAGSTPIRNLLEIIQELDFHQRRAFLQFVTGAPRLPPGGLASLNPKLTIVRKHCDRWVDEELPSVMTCANYFKLPPYTSKEKMKEKLLYAITEGQGSFHLS